MAKSLAASNPLFEPGSILSVDGNTFRLELNGTCELCERTANDGPGENIGLDVSAMPVPETVALMFFGLLPLTWRGWKQGRGTRLLQSRDCYRAVSCRPGAAGRHG